MLFKSEIKKYLLSKYPTIVKDSIYICDDGTAMFHLADDEELHSVYYDDANQAFIQVR